MVAGFAAAMTKFRLTVALFQFPSVHVIGLMPAAAVDLRCSCNISYSFDM